MSGQIFIAFDGGAPAAGLIVDADCRATMLGGDDIARLNAATARGVLPSEAAAVAAERASTAQPADALPVLQESRR